jgi:hypothetical protein
MTKRIPEQNHQKTGKNRKIQSESPAEMAKKRLSPLREIRSTGVCILRVNTDILPRDNYYL